MGFHHVGQVGLELLTLGNPPALAFQSVGITGVSHGAQPTLQNLEVKSHHEKIICFGEYHSFFFFFLQTINFVKYFGLCIISQKHYVYRGDYDAVTNASIAAYAFNRSFTL